MYKKLKVNMQTYNGHYLSKAQVWRRKHEQNNK